MITICMRNKHVINYTDFQTFQCMYEANWAIATAINHTDSLGISEYSTVASFLRVRRSCRGYTTLNEKGEPIFQKRPPCNWDAPQSMKMAETGYFQRRKRILGAFVWVCGRFLHSPAELSWRVDWAVKLNSSISSSALTFAKKIRTPYHRKSLDISEYVQYT